MPLPADIQMGTDEETRFLQHLGSEEKMLNKPIISDIQLSISWWVQGRPQHVGYYHKDLMKSRFRPYTDLFWGT